MKTIRCRVIQGMVMPDGWHFQVNPSLRLEADTFPELIKVVEEYRVSNNMPIGEPLDDVVNYICSTPLNSSSAPSPPFSFLMRFSTRQPAFLATRPVFRMSMIL